MSEQLEAEESEVDDWIAKAGLPPGVARPVTVHGTPVLHRPCRPVTVFDAALKQLVADMFASMAAADGVGLAANQIGVDASVFVFDCPDGDDVIQVGCVINPTVVLAPGDDELDEDTEGCLSVPGLFAELARPARASVVGQDLRGREIRVDGTGVLARCLQHETDHLNGLLYVDRLDADARAAVLAELDRRLRAAEIPPWSAAFPGAP